MSGSGKHIVIDPAQCKGCRLCVEVCPRGCITIGSKTNMMGYAYAKFGSSNCTACGLCFYMCPEPGAITVYDEDPEFAGKE